MILAAKGEVEEVCVPAVASSSATMSARGWNWRAESVHYV